MVNLIGLLIGSSILGGGGAPAPPTFPCTILANQTYTVTSDTVTNCDPIFIENGGTLVIDQPYTLTQNNP